MPRVHGTGHTQCHGDTLSDGNRTTEQNSRGGGGGSRGGAGAGRGFGGRGGGAGAGAGGRPMVRAPREPIGEDQAVESSYGVSDQRRNQFGASEALVPGGGPKSYEFRESEQEEEQQQQQQQYEDDGLLLTGVVQAPSRVPRNYKHKCSACASGACRNRRVPRSKKHDANDGDTASTRSSIITNSSIDKTEFVDRDDDFSAFEVDFNFNNDGGVHNFNNDDIFDNDSVDPGWVDV